MSVELTAEAFEVRLRAHQSDVELAKIQRYFTSGLEQFIGVRMGTVFGLAKESIDMPLDQVEAMLESDVHEMRVGALSIMAKKAAHKKTDDETRQALFDLYLRRHDRIDNWDLVDLAARHVVGLWLVDRPKDVLHELSRSDNMWERRTALYACVPLIAHHQTGDTLAISALLVADPEELIHKAVGTVLRSVGQEDRAALLAFLDEHASRMPRIMLTYAIEHLDAAQKADYRSR